MTSMIRQFFSALTLVWAASFAASAMAHGTDQEQIQHAMMATFDKPNNPLKVAPVVVQGDYAVAGWIQGDKGGRALLQKTKSEWQISACGGGGLTQAKVLETTGMSAASAKTLASAVLVAESKLTAHQRHLFDSFEGMMKIEAGQASHGQDEANGAHAAHAAPAK
ncbi:MAG: copper uptake system-associated protein [Comamonadaceae bacterium]